MPYSAIKRIIGSLTRRELSAPNPLASNGNIAVDMQGNATGDSQGKFRNDIAKDWVESPYYDLVEDQLYYFWNQETPFLRLFQSLDLRKFVELACGHGRHTEYILKNHSPESVVLVDILESNISYCKERFANDSRVTCIQNNGYELKEIADNSMTSLFCYDAMVHFEYDDISEYLKEIDRILVPGGEALLHHSNNDKQPGNVYSENVHWRNYMTASLFKHLACRANLLVLEQEVFDWGEAVDLDCLTLVGKPL